MYPISHPAAHTRKRACRHSRLPPTFLVPPPPTTAMDDDRGHRDSFFEAQSSSKSSVTSTVSSNSDGVDTSLDGEPRQLRTGQQPEIRRFDEGSDSDSSSCEDARHDQRADLARMMSRRNFAVGIDGLPLAAAHRVRTSSGGTGTPGGGVSAAAAAGEAAATATATAAAAAAAYDGAHNNNGRRRSSTMGSAATAAVGGAVEASEVAPEDQGQSNQVCVLGSCVMRLEPRQSLPSRELLLCVMNLCTAGKAIRHGLVWAPLLMVAATYCCCCCLFFQVIFYYTTYGACHCGKFRSEFRCSVHWIRLYTRQPAAHLYHLRTLHRRHKYVEGHARFP